MALMGVVPFGNFVGADTAPADALPETSQPRFYFNKSGRFESRFPTVTIEPSPAIMLQGMEVRLHTSSK
eukprot:SAG31_NODE_4135_length_3550_cov_2.327731_1_plen_69_part_00